MFSVRSGCVSEMKICPNISSFTILTICWTLKASNLSKISSKSKIGKVFVCFLMKSNCANFKAIKNDFCYPCEPNFFTGKSEILNKMSSL